MKADFKKWYTEPDEYTKVVNIWSDLQILIINQFAEDYAKKEAIEFLKWDDKGSGIIRHLIDYENKYREYQKFKDDESTH